MLLAFSVTPIGSGSASVSAQVAEAVRVVRASGLPNRTDAMFTTIEGEWGEVFAVVKGRVAGGCGLLGTSEPHREGRLSPRR